MFCIACEFLKGLGKTVMDGHFSQTDLAGNLNCVTISVTSFKRLNLSASRGYVCDHTQVTELLGRSKERTSVRCLAWCLLACGHSFPPCLSPPTPTMAWRSSRKTLQTPRASLFLVSLRLSPRRPLGVTFNSLLICSRTETTHVCINQKVSFISPSPAERKGRQLGLALGEQRPDPGLPGVRPVGGQEVLGEAA